MQCPITPALLFVPLMSNSLYLTLRKQITIQKLDKVTGSVVSQFRLASIAIFLASHVSVLSTIKHTFLFTPTKSI